eukprot:12634349-Prorocentrum_lima.AAC.1
MAPGSELLFAWKEGHARHDLRHAFPFLLGSGAAVPVLCKTAPLSPRTHDGCAKRPRKAKMDM